MTIKQFPLIKERTAYKKATAEEIFDVLDVSEATRADYKYRVGLFLEFIKHNRLHKNSFLEFKRYLGNRSDFSVNTKNKYLTTAKIFLKELNRQFVLPVDITQNIKSFSQDKKHKKDGLNDKEMGKLSDKLQQLPNTPQNTRLKAIISLLALQGLRQIEIIRLDVEDLDLIGKAAFVHGKGRDDKEPIDLHPQTVHALKDYLKSNKKASGALFTSMSNCHYGERLTTRSVRKFVSRFLKQFGIQKSTHGFRHYFTTTLIKSYKGDLLDVAQYTQHKDVNSEKN